MSTQTTEPTEVTERYERGDGDETTPAKRALSTARAVGTNGTALSIAGGVCLALAARAARRNRRRAGVFALLGAGLLGVGLRRRGTDADADQTDRAAAGDVSTESDRGEDQHSAEATAHLEQSKVMHQDETNPRGVSGEPDVESETDSDEGDIRFTTEHDEDVEPKPHLDGEADDPKDPRYAEGDDPETADDHVEVDLSEATMADEASEAVAPDDEQAYPASEGTDPEPTPDEAPEYENEDADVGEDEGDESTEGGEAT